MDYRNNYNEWLGSEYVDEDTKAELRAIADDEKEIEGRFTAMPGSPFLVIISLTDSSMNPRSSAIYLFFPICFST